MSSAKKPMGRPRKPVHSRLMQIQPHTQVPDEDSPIPATASLAAPLQTRFAATIRLTPALLKALEQQLAGGAGQHAGGASCSIQFGAKENDVSLIVDGVAHKLRCAKETATTEVYQSKVYAGDSTSNEEDAMHDAGADSLTTATRKPPLFDPYMTLLSPLPHVKLAYKYSVVKELTEDVKREVKEKSASAQQEYRASKVVVSKELGVASRATTTTTGGAAATAAAKKSVKRKDAPSTATAAAIPKKPKATNSHPSPHLLSPTAGTPNQTAVGSPTAVLTPAAAVSPSAGSAASPAASSSTAPPRLLRSPSTAALPSSLTAHEKLRSRLIHFLAAQVHGLPMATLINRLGVRPENMKGTLSTVATYESPGAYYLRVELYAELLLATWPDYTEEDRRRVVAKMERLGLEVKEEWRQWKPTLGDAASVKHGATALTPTATTTTPNGPQAGATAMTDIHPSAQPAAAAAASSSSSSSPFDPLLSPLSPAGVPSSNAVQIAAGLVAPLLSPALPPMPNLDALPSEVPASLCRTEQLASGEVVQREAPPAVIKDYLEYLAVHTQFLHQRRAYTMLGAWLKAIAHRTIGLKAARDHQADPAVKSALKKQLVAFVREYETQRERVEQRQRVLHVILRAAKQALHAFAEQYQMFAARPTNMHDELMAPTTEPNEHAATGLGGFVSPEPVPMQTSS